MWTSAELKYRAKGAFYKNYWNCVLIALVMTFFAGVASETVVNFAQDQGYYFQMNSWMGSFGFRTYRPLFGMFGLKLLAGMVTIVFLFVKIFIGNPLYVSGSRFFIQNQTMNPSVATLTYGFKSNGYTNVVLIMFLRNLFTSLWSLLFVIPGIIKHYEYLMIPYILAENPQMDQKEAFLISKRMMNGQKMNAFILDLSFIGWKIVSVVTFRLGGVFFVNPYYQATFAELYSVNRSRAYQEGYIR